MRPEVALLLLRAQIVQRQVPKERWEGGCPSSISIEQVLQLKQTRERHERQDRPEWVEIEHRVRVSTNDRPLRRRWDLARKPKACP